MTLFKALIYIIDMIEVVTPGSYINSFLTNPILIDGDRAGDEIVYSE